MNLGNPGEFTILELATMVKELTGSTSEIVFEPLLKMIRSAAPGHHTGEGETWLGADDPPAGYMLSLEENPPRWGQTV